MAKLPTAAMDTAIPGEDYPFHIQLRGGDVPNVSAFKLIFKSGCKSENIVVPSSDLAADPAADPPVDAGKAVSGHVPKSVTSQWYDIVTWVMTFDDDGNDVALIGGTFKTEFEGMLT